MSRNELLTMHHFTVFDLPPERFIDLAAVAGCSQVCLFVEAPDDLLGADGEPLFHVVDAGNLRSVREHLASSGVGVANLEFYPIDAAPDFERFRASLARGAELGGRTAVVHLHDTQPSRAGDHLGQFCELASSLGLSAGLEFMPATPGCPTLASAVGYVRNLGCANLGVAVDVLHAHLSGATPGDLASIAQHELAYAQLCDIGQAACDRLQREPQAYLDVAFQRLYPGEGIIPLRDLVASLPADLPWDIEVPRPDYRERGLDPQGHLARAVAAARDCLSDN